MTRSAILEAAFAEQLVVTNTDALLESFAHSSPFTAEHIKNVGSIALRLIHELGGTDEEAIAAGLSGIWHDAGKGHVDLRQDVNSTKVFDADFRRWFSKTHTYLGGQAVALFFRPTKDYPAARDTALYGALYHHGAHDDDRPPLDPAHADHVLILSIVDRIEACLSPYRRYRRKPLPAEQVWSDVLESMEDQVELFNTPLHHVVTTACLLTQRVLSEAPTYVKNSEG